MDSLTLLPHTGNQLNITGNRQKGAGYTNFGGATHTVQISVNNFVGRIFIEASLATDPQESDWFAVSLENDQPFIQYPRDPARPSGFMQGDTSTLAWDFVGNYVWVRARLDRTYLTPQPQDANLVGSVTQILLNYGALGGGVMTQMGGLLPITGPRGPAGFPGATGAPGSVGPTGATGVKGDGIIYEFVINYDGSGAPSSVSNLPSGWSASTTNTNVIITHDVNTVPSGFYMWGRQTSTSNVYTVRSPNNVMNMTYNVTIPQVFTLVNVTATNVGTVSDGQARAVILFT